VTLYITDYATRVLVRLLHARTLSLVNFAVFLGIYDLIPRMTDIGEPAPANSIQLSSWFSIYVWRDGFGNTTVVSL
jgi:hypothetical protein